MHTVTAVAPRVSLRSALPDAQFVGGDDFALQSCSCDSRRLRPGQVFVAIRGAQGDGHDHIAEAVANGASGLIVERQVDNLGLPCCVVADSRQAFGRLCQILAGNPSQQLKVIGVTGTNGKTTTAWLISSVLSTAGAQVGLLGTIANYDGLEWMASTHTTPPADQLAKHLGHMAANGCSHAVMEVSSHALDQARVAGMQFDAACVTNVRRDHLDYHRTLSGYRLAKSRLFNYLSPEGFAVVNADDATAAAYLPQIDGPVLTVGMHSAAEITATLLEQHLSEQTFLMAAGSDAIPVRTEMIGLHHVYNCLVAAAVGLAYGIDLPTVVRGLEAVRSVPGRLQRIECGQPYGVFVDYAHTPDALAAVLSTLRDVVGGRLICVFGAGGERDRQKRPLMGRAVEQYAHLAVLTSDNPRGEDPEEINAQILSGITNPAAVQCVADRSRAIDAAFDAARPGDCVLIAGKGHEAEQIIGGERLSFDDADVARQKLYSRMCDESEHPRKKIA